MENRSLALLVLLCSGAYSALMLLDVFSGQSLGDLGRASWMVGTVGVAGGLRLLWSTGLYRYSPLWRFQYFAIVFLLLAYMMRIMHWPYGHLLMLLAIGTMLVIYSIHFVLKPRKALRDILRLLVVVLTACMFAFSYLHIMPDWQALWIGLGMVSIAMVEFLMNPMRVSDPHAPKEATPPAPPAADPADPSADNMDDEHPELFQ